jgi:hypothetical protein
MMNNNKKVYISAKINSELKYFTSFNELYKEKENIEALYIKGFVNLPYWIFKLKNNKIIELLY